MSWPRPSATFPAKSLCVRHHAINWYHTFSVVSTTVTEESKLSLFISLLLVLGVPPTAKHQTQLHARDQDHYNVLLLFEQDT